MRRTCLLLALLLMRSICHASPALDKQLVGGWVGADGTAAAFTADHGFRLYPKCGPDADDWRRRGIPFLAATWAITRAGQLSLTFGTGTAARTATSTVEVAGDEMRLTDDHGRLHVSRRYTGPLPPACPATPP